MLPTTLRLLRAALEADPTVRSADRNRSRIMLAPHGQSPAIKEDFSRLQGAVAPFPVFVAHKRR
jgi:hypothetical protein